MPSIRIRSQSNTLTLNDRGVAIDNNSSVEAVVEVLLSNGLKKSFNFKGFRDFEKYRDSLLPVQFVKVVNVEAFFVDDYARPTQVDNNGYCVGVFEENECAVYLLLDQDKLVHRRFTNGTGISKFCASK